MATVGFPNPRDEAIPAGEPPSPAREMTPPPANDDSANEIAKRANDLGAIRDSVNDAAAVSGGLWITYLSVMSYLAVATAAVTHVDLFLQRPVILPLLNVPLPLLAFFFIAPLLFLIVHAYTLLHFDMLAAKAVRFHEALRKNCVGTKNPDETRDNLRRQLPANIFVQFLAGPPETREGLFGWALRVIAWITLVIAPLGVCLLIQVQFLPYQSVGLTWLHRFTLLIDLALLWWLWPKVLRGRDQEDSASRGRLGRRAALGGMIALIYFSISVATFENEAQAGLMPLRVPLIDIGEIGDTAPPEQCESKQAAISPTRWRLYDVHDYIFKSPIQCLSRKRLFPISSTLVLSGQDLVVAADAQKTAAGGFVISARERRLDGAVFDHATLPKTDFEGARLERASFLETKIVDANFHLARLEHARFLRARAQGASFDVSKLGSASFLGSDLHGADFSGTVLAGVDLSSVNLMGADFRGACLQNAKLTGSVLFGTDFAFAQMRDADLQNADIFASFFTRAKLSRVDLRAARIESSDFHAAALRSTLGPAKLEGALHSGVANANDAETYDKQAPCPEDKAADKAAPSPDALQEQLKTARNDSDLLSGEKASARFVQGLCADYHGAFYYLRSPAFHDLHGPEVPAIIDYLIGGDKPVELSDDDRASLTLKRMQERGAHPGADARAAPHC